MEVNKSSQRRSELKGGVWEHCTEGREEGSKGHSKLYWRNACETTQAH